MVLSTHPRTIVLVHLLQSGTQGLTDNTYRVSGVAMAGAGAWIASTVVKTARRGLEGTTESITYRQ